MEEPAPTHVPANTPGSLTIVILTWVMPAIATIAVVLRMLSRRMQRLKTGTDDILIMVALLPLWGHTAIILVTVYLGGVGHPAATLQPGNSVALFKGLTALQYSFGTSLGLIKASILFLLMRIFYTKTFKRLARIVLVYIICWALMCIFIGSFLCRPFAKNWNPQLPGVCGNLFQAHTCIAALDILGNLLIIILPLPWIWKLHQSRATRIFLTGIFVLGILDVACGILRVVYLTQLLNATDIQGNAVNTWVWSVCEPSIAMVVACGPTYKPLLRLFRGQSPAHGDYKNNPRSTFVKGSQGTQRSTFDDDDAAYGLDPVRPLGDSRTVVHAAGAGQAGHPGHAGHPSFGSDEQPFVLEGVRPAGCSCPMPHDDSYGRPERLPGHINLQREVRVDYRHA